MTAQTERSAEDDGDPDPTSAGTTGDAALRGGSSVAMGRTANQSGAIKLAQMVGNALASWPARGSERIGVGAFLLAVRDLRG